jgi:hypothetical protein
MEENKTTEGSVVEDGTIENFGYNPCVLHTDELIGLPYVEKITIDKTHTTIIGNVEQRIAFCISWAKYMCEVENPKTTAVNPAFVERGGKPILYAPLDEVLNNARPVLGKYGLGFMQVPEVEAGKVSIQNIITHESGFIMGFPQFSLQAIKVDAQSTISLITYARRGSFNPIFGTHGEVDNDGNDNGDKTPKKPDTTKTEIPEDVKSKQKLVCAVLKELIDIKKDDIKYKDSLYLVVKNICGATNPNSVADIKLLDATYAALDKIRTEQKAGK